MTRLATALLLALPSAALGWGAPGHEIVAAIAEDRMSPAARELVHELVGEEPLSAPDITSWADAQRDPRTRPWHYVNVPLALEFYDAARDCRRGCAVRALEEHLQVLAGDGPRRDRAIALRWVVHLVADLHQPLHAGDVLDRGGNQLLVRLGRRRQPITFHHLWDTEIVTPILRRRGPLVAARAIEAAIEDDRAAAWASDLSPATWANESHRTAQLLYAELGARPGELDQVVLPESYLEDERPLAAGALARAGVRLAAILDNTARNRHH